VFKLIKRTGLCGGHAPPTDRPELGNGHSVLYYSNFFINMDGCRWIRVDVVFFEMGADGTVRSDQRGRRDVGSDGSKWIWIHPFLH
jgi:hypothetical protein